MQRTLVAIPALNESTTIGGVIEEVARAVPSVDILVVDDGSTDTTASAARRAGAQVVSLPFNVGVGGAMRTAFLYAQRNDYDAVVQVDADGQHIPTHIPDLLDALEGASVVVGARFTGHGDYSVRGPRRWAMRVLARSLSRVCHSDLTDTTSGFRAADRRAISLFARHYPAEYLGDTVESLVI
ncbi:MAG TPA: glycosyltransferase family 2 protein, partial [Candidatus Limnocylindrales bacterium]|nr:glycosyltransferase family 2 protein [Candidatus Limnocylindrales bacterium]